MLHDPHGDSFKASTNELICTLMGRIDAPNSMLSLLALMVEASEGMPIYRQYCMAGSLVDAAAMIMERPDMRFLVDLGLPLPSIADSLAEHGVDDKVMDSDEVRLAL